MDEADQRLVLMEAFECSDEFAGKRPVIADWFCNTCRFAARLNGTGCF